MEKKLAEGQEFGISVYGVIYTLNVNQYTKRNFVFEKEAEAFRKSRIGDLMVNSWDGYIDRLHSLQGKLLLFLSNLLILFTNILLI